MASSHRPFINAMTFIRPPDRTKWRTGQTCTDLSGSQPQEERNPTNAALDTVMTVLKGKCIKSCTHAPGS